MTKLEELAKKNPNIQNFANQINPTIETVNGAALRNVEASQIPTALEEQQKASQDAKHKYDERTGNFGPDKTKDTEVSEEAKNKVAEEEQQRTIALTPDKEAAHRQNAQEAYYLNNLSDATLQKLYYLSNQAGNKGNYSALNQFLTPSEYNRALFKEHTQSNYDLNNDGISDWTEFEHGNYTLKVVKRMKPDDQLRVLKLAESYLAYMGNKLNVPNILDDVDASLLKANGFSKQIANKVNDARDIVQYMYKNSNKQYTEDRKAVGPISYNITLSDSKNDATMLIKLYNDLVSIKKETNEYIALQNYFNRNNTPIHEINTAALQSTERSSYLQKQLNNNLNKVISKVKTDPAYTYNTLIAYYDAVAANQFTNQTIRDEATNRANAYRQRIPSAKKLATNVYKGKED